MRCIKCLEKTCMHRGETHIFYRIPLCHFVIMNPNCRENNINELRIIHMVRHFYLTKHPSATLLKCCFQKVVIMIMLISCFSKYCFIYMSTCFMFLLLFEKVSCINMHQRIFVLCECCTQYESNTSRRF